MMTRSSYTRLASGLLLGLAGLGTGTATVHAQSSLPLSGPAFVLADEAYKAYARGDYASAVDKAREALRLRPDATELQSLLRKAQAGRAAPTRAQPQRNRRVPEARVIAPITKAAQLDPVPSANSAFASADAAYKSYGRGDYTDAVKQARTALQLAPDNRDYRLLLINALVAADRLEEADEVIAQALALQAGDPDVVAQRDALRGHRAQGLGAAAYKAFDAGDYAQAAANAQQALQLAPANRDYRSLLVSALYRDGQYQTADEAASTALADDSRNAALMVQRGLIRQRRGMDDLARQDFEAALGTGPLPAATQIGLLADLGRKQEARQRFDAAVAAGGFGTTPDTDIAYLAARVGDDRQALASFNRADASGKLVNTAYQDAAFSAVRTHNDEQAIAYFKRTVDDAMALTLRMEPQLLFNTRRAVAEVSRETGVIASLTYRGAVSGLGVAPGTGSDSLQGGIEAYWRPWGYRNGQYAELFARAFQTLYNKGGALGGPTGAVGARYKPLATHNLVVSLSRVFSGSGGRNDWLAQLGYSAGYGTDLRIDVPSWWTTRVSAEAGRYLSGGQSYALAEVQAGRSIRVGEADTRWVVFPHLSMTGNYDSSALEQTAFGLGPGVTARYWFREDRYAAPRSYFDLSLHYRARLSGAQRAQGVFLSTAVSY